MTFVEAIIIYLSAGAPFGVLVFFSRPADQTPVSLMYALITTFTWPVFGTYRLYLGLRRGEARPSPLDVTPLETLIDLSEETPTQTAELFEIAGHPNPWLATNCYARARMKVIESHIERITKASILGARHQGALLEEAVPLSQPASIART